MLSVQFSRSVMSNSLRPRGLQYARLPHPSPTLLLYHDSNCCSSICKQNQGSHGSEEAFSFPSCIFQCLHIFVLLWSLCICACCNHTSWSQDGALSPGIHLLQNAEAADYKKCLRQEGQQEAVGLLSAVNYFHILLGSGQSSGSILKGLLGRKRYELSGIQQEVIFNFWRILM